MIDMSMVQHDAYERLYGEKLDDFGADGLVLRHKKSGARICLCASENNNKLFSITFRTPPKNSTGVAHILEHSVLNGSEKYPLKDPFNELCKGSFQTYLNASTYPDMTTFPVASTNDKDFHNLVDVYMDAVLHPNIYKSDKIFRQEGWRYHLENVDDPITINGVVYSEMKGSFSDAETQLYQAMKINLLPDTPYGYCSGGDPEVIPELTYEEFLAFHTRYYHPSNAYIFLYGDMDMVAYLDYLDRDYLSQYDARPVDAELSVQKPFGIRQMEMDYPIGEQDEEENRAFIAWGSSMEAHDPLWYTAWMIVLGVTFAIPGAPIKKALVDAGICEDCDYCYEKDRQFFSYVYGKGADASKQKEFNEIIVREAERLYRDGLNHKSILGYLKSCEYDCRETRTKKAAVGMCLMDWVKDGWLYDDNDAFFYCRQLETYEKLRDLIETGYFEEVLRDIFLKHENEVHMLMKPKKGLTAEQDEKLVQKLAAYKETLSEEQLQQLVDKTRELKEYQETPDSPEVLAKIPHLQISDIRRTANAYPYETYEVEGVPVIYYEGNTNGIVYFRLNINVTDLPKEELPYLALLNSALLRMNTDKHTYQELNDEIMLHVGTMYSQCASVGVEADYHQFVGLSMHKFNALLEEAPIALEYMREMICDTDFTDKKRLLEIIREDRNGIRSSMVYNGSNIARSQCFMHLHAMDYYRYYVRDNGKYNALVEWQENFENCADDIIAHMKGVLAYCLDRKKFTIAIIGERASLSQLMPLMPGFIDGLRSKDVNDGGTDANAAYVVKPAEKLPWEGGYPIVKKNEAITYSGKVNFWGIAGNFREAGYEWTGQLSLAARIVSRNYLYQNIRIKGGAYGVGFSAQNLTGIAEGATYRDPNLGRSLEVFRGIPEYLSNLDISDEELTKAVIGMMGQQDYPTSIESDGEQAVSDYYSGIHQENRQRRRDEILSVTPEILRAQAPVFRAILDNGCYACFVGEENIKNEPDLFDTVVAMK